MLPYRSWNAHTELAELYSSEGLDDRADREYQAALKTARESRAQLHDDEVKVKFFAALIRVQQNYIDFLMSRGHVDKALEFAEASRALLLQERLGAIEEPEAHSAAAYRQLARDAGYVLVSYWLGPKRSYVWVTTARNTVAYPLPPQDRIYALVEAYRALIENMHDPLDSEDTSGRDLYETLLAPLLDRIPADAHIVIAADAGLHALNFESLPVATPRPHYFIEDATISMVPSLNLLTGNSWDRRVEGRLLLIGDANSSDTNYPNLPYAAKEIQLVAGHFPTSLVTTYTKEAALPAVYRQAGPAGFAFVHFTAHASANRLEPLDSAIMLSGPVGANQLTAREVERYPMTARLVTISACRSAGAKTFAGEGLVGFMWAFFRSGAKNIIAGLWDVSDDSTPKLMDQLYANLMAGKPPAEALRAAKLTLMRSNRTWRLPYYWAPFQLYVRELTNPRPRARG